jgi:hypothetical protein
LGDWVVRKKSIFQFSDAGRSAPLLDKKYKCDDEESGNSKRAIEIHFCVPQKKFGLFIGLLDLGAIRWTYRSWTEKFSCKGREYSSKLDGKQATPPGGAVEVGRKSLGRWPLSKAS